MTAAYSTFGQAASQKRHKTLPRAGTAHPGEQRSDPGQPHCSPTRRPHLRPSIDEEHSRVLLSRLQIVRFVHHPIERKACGTLEGEHFWGNVIRKGACRRREQRVWLNREWMDSAASAAALPHHRSRCNSSGALLHFPVDVAGTRRDWECPRGAFSGPPRSHPCSPLNRSNFSPLTQPLQVSHPFLTPLRTNCINTWKKMP